MALRWDGEVDADLTIIHGDTASNPAGFIAEPHASMPAFHGGTN